MAHLTRYYMYKKIEECLGGKIGGRILGITGIDNFLPLICKDADVLVVQYPEVDMQNMPFGDHSFDFVISDQVIAHLQDPQKAVSESYRVLKKGGIAIHTTCFMTYIDIVFKDYWRFSPAALRYLSKEFSEVLESTGWGNRFAILLCFLSARFRFMRIPEAHWSIRRFFATYNEERYPIVTWIIAKK